MTKRLDWQPYVSDLAARMKLGHWTITVLDEPPREGALASVHPWYGRHAASVRFADGFPTESPEEQRYVVVHELVHCLLAHADRIVEDELSAAAGTAHRLASEYAVDALTTLIASSLPLPPSSEPE